MSQRIYSLAYLSSHRCTPAQAIGVAAQTGYHFVGLRLWPNAAGAPQQQLLGQPEALRETLAAQRDTGVGVPADKVADLFNAFEQADTSTTRRFGGTGLGLSICKRLTGLMGGWVEVRSALDEGSTFTVTVPFEATQAPRREVDDSPTLVTQSGAHFAPSGGPLVLVAEDNAINQKVIGHQLALLGVSVEMVSDGLEALALWRAGSATQRHALLLGQLLGALVGLLLDHRRGQQAMLEAEAEQELATHGVHQHLVAERRQPAAALHVLDPFDLYLACCAPELLGFDLPEVMGHVAACLHQLAGRVVATLVGAPQGRRSGYARVGVQHLPDIWRQGLVLPFVCCRHECRGVERATAWIELTVKLR